MTKLERVKIALENEIIRTWYEEVCELGIDTLTERSVKDYGFEGQGYLADSIIQDAIDSNILSDYE